MHVVFSPSCLHEFLTTTNASNATVMINIDIYVEVYTYMNVSVCEYEAFTLNTWQVVFKVQSVYLRKITGRFATSNMAYVQTDRSKKSHACHIQNCIVLE